MLPAHRRMLLLERGHKVQCDRFFPESQKKKRLCERRSRSLVLCLHTQHQCMQAMQGSKRAFLVSGGPKVRIYRVRLSFQGSPKTSAFLASFLLNQCEIGRKVRGFPGKNGDLPVAVAAGEPARPGLLFLSLLPSSPWARQATIYRLLMIPRRAGRLMLRAYRTSNRRNRV